ncbi:hypothetical protein AA313_de0204132 [Arthrobotrys entomopaga]|nr:hypothetical protein AA313_de0204132 [Arthrobotrys entomopaga]
MLKNTRNQTTNAHLQANLSRGIGLVRSAGGSASLNIRPITLLALLTALVVIPFHDLSLDLGNNTLSLFLLPSLSSLGILTLFTFLVLALLSDILKELPALSSLLLVSVVALIIAIIVIHHLHLLPLLEPLLASLEELGTLLLLLLLSPLDVVELSLQPRWQFLDSEFWISLTGE